MHETALQLMSVLFDPEDTVCVGPDKYAYRSIEQSELAAKTILLTPNSDSRGEEKIVTPDQISLISINAVNGDRIDTNTTKLRSFLVELDDGPIPEQHSYVSMMNMPYSACVFSGNKSLHFVITLSEPLPSLEIYRFYAEWILKIMNKADQSTKNPTRMVRCPGHKRDGGKTQSLISLRNRITQDDLSAWLSGFQALRPQIREKRVPATPSDANVLALPRWAQNQLGSGINEQRNNRWFAIAYECALLGWDEDDTVDALSAYFSEDLDFTHREWEYAVRNGHRKAGD